MRTLLSACLVLGCLNQGIARAEEASDRPAGNVTVVPDSAALARALARMAPGDRILASRCLLHVGQSRPTRARSSPSSSKSATAISSSIAR